MTDPKLRESLIAHLGELQRELSNRTVVFHQLVGERLGLGPTDHKCLDLAVHAAADAPVTAGKLAEVTGLTGGAITGVIDRLVRAGYVRREKAIDDRRQTHIRLVPERVQDIARMYEPLSSAWESFCTKYTDEELNAIFRFTKDAIEMMAAQLERMKAEPPAAAPIDGITVPLGDLRRAQLVFTRGAHKVRLGDATDGVLLRAVWDGPPPRLKAEAGEVQIQGDKHGGRVALATSVPWTVHFRGGAAALDADLHRVPVEEFEIAGGASDVKIRLGAPRGTTPVRIRGGGSRITIVRPADIPARVEVRGGASGVAIETLKIGDVGGPLRWESPEYERAHERFDIEVTGGVAALTVGVG